MPRRRVELGGDDRDHPGEGQRQRRDPRVRSSRSRPSATLATATIAGYV